MRVQRGALNHALGRSRGGFTTKIHARTNAEGLPIALLLTPGEPHDSTAFPNLTAEYDVDPEVMLGDKGYDSDTIRDEVRARGGQPEIPTKKNRIVQRTVNRGYMRPTTGSSASSIDSKTADASPPDTTTQQAVSGASQSSPQSGSG